MMKIIFVPKLCHRSGRHGQSLPKLYAVVTLVLSMVVGGALWGGYQFGINSVVVPVVEHDANEDALRSLMAEQRKELQNTQQQTREHLDALALKLGKMQSHVLRIDALGERLAQMGKLDLDEFNFDRDPPQGGLGQSDLEVSTTAVELASEMESLFRTLEDREHKLELMEGLMVNDKLNEEFRISGRPIKKGWVSSRYGYRKDPFTGKKSFHRGVDLAGKKNSEVIAVAAGIVTVAKKKSGFGYTVELRHAGGYTTRYGHNSSLLVKVGDMVSKGQTIALMGTSGRSTGPHVHFEIARNGKSVNPQRYLRAK